MSQRFDEESPTLPLPPPRASRVSLEDLIEAATTAAQRATPTQPIGGEGKVQPHPPIWVGIVIYPPSPFLNPQFATQVNASEE
jgi:hypothetical protein